MRSSPSAATLTKNFLTSFLCGLDSCSVSHWCFWTETYSDATRKGHKDLLLGSELWLCVDSSSFLFPIYKMGLTIYAWCLGQKCAQH